MFDRYEENEIEPYVFQEFVESNNDQLMQYAIADQGRDAAVQAYDHACDIAAFNDWLNIAKSLNATYYGKVTK